MTLGGSAGGKKYKKLYVGEYNFVNVVIFPYPAVDIIIPIWPALVTFQVYILPLQGPNLTSLAVSKPLSLLEALTSVGSKFFLYFRMLPMRLSDNA